MDVYECTRYRFDCGYLRPQNRIGRVCGVALEEGVDICVELRTWTVICEQSDIRVAF